MSIDSNAALANTDGVAFPDNAAVNATGPAATDGTEYVKILIDNYMLGPMQAILSQTGQTPSGSVEVAAASQMLEGIIRLASKGVVFTDSGAADAYVLTRLSGLQSPVAYYDGQEAVFKADFANAGASTVNIDGIGAKSITLQDGSSLPAGVIVAGEFSTIRYNLAADRFELIIAVDESQLSKAWVNFNGTGVVAINSSFNVSSITDNGIGDYTVNFTSSFADTNYAAIPGGEGVIQTNLQAQGLFSIENKTVSSVDIIIFTAPSDSPDISLTVFS